MRRGGFGAVPFSTQALTKGEVGAPILPLWSLWGRHGAGPGTPYPQWETWDRPSCAGDVGRSYITLGVLLYQRLLF